MGYYLLRLVAATLVGCLVGMICNRDNNTYSQRSYALISLGAALVSVTGLGLYQNLGAIRSGDPGLMMAQIISALGFLGTGMIWITEDKKVMGMTHAASLWITAILGMMIGIGLSEPTSLGVFFFIIIFWVSRELEKYDIKRFFRRR